MPAYLITGPNGSGKSTAGRVLEARGYTVIETDFASGVAGWTDTVTGERVTDLPDYPFSSDWLEIHRWLWNKNVLERLIAEHADHDVFFVGGAYNQKEMYDLFTSWFVLYTERETTIKRLQSRGEGDRWKLGSPELARSLAWQEKSKEISRAQGAILVDSSQPPEAVANEILSMCHVA